MVDADVVWRTASKRAIAFACLVTFLNGSGRPDIQSVTTPAFAAVLYPRIDKSLGPTDMRAVEWGHVLRGIRQAIEDTRMRVVGPASFEGIVAASSAHRGRIGGIEGDRIETSITPVVKLVFT